MTSDRSPAAAGPAADDWAVLRRTRSNTLLTGARTDTERAIRSLLPHLRAPVVHWRPNAPREAARHATGTLIVREVDALDSRQQRRLLESLEASDRVQVISIASAPVYPLVQSGKFAEDLYYRLNVVCLDF
jgi:Sigma-54 interaction domain